jgi:hypothetical protein
MDEQNNADDDKQALCPGIRVAMDWEASIVRACVFLTRPTGDLDHRA